MHEYPQSIRIGRTAARRVWKTAVAAGVALAFASAAAAQQGAHEHGIADLRVAVDGGEVLIEFDSPLGNLVGFEHAPTTPEQRSALAAAERRLKDFDGLFALPAAAGCVLGEVQLESPYPQGSDDHDHDHHDHDHGHADMYVVYHLECASPAALTAMRVNLIEAFPRIGAIRAGTVTARGQGSLRMDRSVTVLPL